MDFHRCVGTKSALAAIPGYVKTILWGSPVGICIVMDDKYPFMLLIKPNHTVFVGRLNSSQLR